ncbi:hypothetical protein ACFSAG_14140 [Sphingorhabdus buctiana]|uniref:Uncharacterized protein n=1 Tax=Sphingorhabdus buctiana TaxID=1508805 RepID=A0ABW4MHH2_9SPHN
MTSQAFPEEQAPTLGEILAACLKPGPLSDDEAMHFAGFHLAGLIAHNSTADFEQVWREMTHLPEGLLVLLDNREGWQALSSVICGLLGVDTAPVTPVIH